MLDRLGSMAVFVAAVDQGSFAAAAEACRISPAMVGKHVRFLEERVGARLLNRTTRRQSLTDAGQLFYARCKQLLADAEAAEAVGDTLRAAPRGLLKLHAPVSFGSQRLAPALAAYLRQHPQVDIDLALSDRTADLVAEGIDAAIRIGPLPDSGLMARELAPYRMWLAAAPAYLAAAGTPKTAQDLARHECLGFAYWRKKNLWRLAKAGRAEQVEVKGRFTANNGQALRAAALAGAGVIMQPEVLLADDVAAGRLTRLLPEYELPARPMYLVYPADKRPTAKLRSFVDFVTAAFGAI